MKENTFDQVWEELKSEGKQERAFYQAAEDLANIVNKIARERIRQGLSQGQLAERCGMKQEAIARFESLRTVPRMDTVLRIANALKLNIEVKSPQDKRTEVLLDTRAASERYKYSASVRTKFKYSPYNMLRS